MYVGGYYTSALYIQRNAHKLCVLIKINTTANLCAISAIHTQYGGNRNIFLHRGCPHRWCRHGGKCELIPCIYAYMHGVLMPI